MKRLMLIACTAIVFVALPRLAAAQPGHMDSPKVTIVVTQDLVVGTAILLPGQYKFQCRMFDGKTFLIVTSVETGKEITRTPCTREVLENKVTATEYRTLLRPDGRRAITVVQIKGDTAAHRLID